MKCKSFIRSLVLITFSIFLCCTVCNAQSYKKTDIDRKKTDSDRKSPQSKPKPTQCDKYWKEGNAAYAKGDYQTAIILFQKGLDENCNSKSKDFASYLTICKNKIAEANPTLELSETNLEYDAAGGELNIVIVTNQKTWSFNNNNNLWLSLQQEDSVLKAVCKENEMTVERNAVFTINAGQKQTTVFVKQTAAADWSEIDNLIVRNMSSSPDTKSEHGSFKGELNKKKQREGLGAYLWKNSEFYFGAWNTGRWGEGILLVPVGNNVFNCPDCAFYVGSWADGKKQGFGKCYNRYGKMIYSGNFANDEPTGIYPNNENPESLSFDVIKYPNGDCYVGEIKDGKRQGQGILLFANGEMWYGIFKNGDRNGEGILIPLKGKITTGTWQGNRHTQKK
ncbi:hypothetical protein FACS1894182_01120 [Bacteroidia bacterium]|nr:hypothetical protein FACS1894182_01120 [Bacteroidia bacterium]